jgi:hypothetical protein
LITRVIYGEECRESIFFLCSLLYSPVNPVSLRTKYPLQHPSLVSTPNITSNPV